jgi:RNA polymerase sigma-70 factor (ECF subfamily)
MLRSNDPKLPVTEAYPSTRWSLVIRAGSPASSLARAALAELCSVYWYPLYAFIRRKGNDPERALDLTQGYFAHLLEKSKFGGIDRGKGRFRAFLRADCVHYLIDQHRRQAARREYSLVSIDRHDAENRYRFEPVDTITPDRLFDRAWAIALLERVLTMLAREYAASGRAELFDRLKVVLVQGKGSAPAAAIAIQLGMTEAAVHTAIHRLRKRYRKVLEAQIMSTLDDPAEVADEIRSLFVALQQ